MSANLPLAARVITEGLLPARSALLQGPAEPATGPAPPDRARGMLLGLAIGDALGNTSDGLSPGERKARWGEIRDYLPSERTGGRRVGLPSDDSRLAFRTVESLLERGGLDPEDLSERLSAAPIPGRGESLRQFLRNRADGMAPWYRCGAESADNGALVRVAPIVLAHPHGASAALWLDTALASIVTHRDACSVASCVAFVDLLARMLRLAVPPPPDWILETFFATVRQVCTDQPYAPRAPLYAGQEGPFPDYLQAAVGDAVSQGWGTQEACGAWGSGAHLLETVPSALWILANHGHDPEEAIVRAVNDTEDNDTVAAIVGAAVGAMHGARALPDRWRWGLAGRTAETDDGHAFRLIEAALRREWT